MPLILPKKKSAAPAEPVQLVAPPIGEAEMYSIPHPRALWEMNDYRTWGERFPDTPWPGSVVRFAHYDAGKR